MDGDGVLDWVRAYKDKNEAIQIATAEGKGAQSDLLTRVTDNLGAKTEVTYKPMTDKSVYAVTGTMLHIRPAILLETC